MRRTAAGVLAGALALSGAVATAVPANAAPTFGLERIQGENRYETSANIARAFVAADGGTVTNVILASGEAGRTADALSASFLAGVQDAPVVLSQQTVIPGATRAVLAALRTQGATTITVVGGPVAISDAQITELRGLGWTVNRVAGADRYATAAAVATAGESATASNVGLLASGVSTIDALAGGPVAFRGKHPLFLTTRDDIPGSIVASMKANGITSVYVLGGEAVVGPRVIAELAANGITVAGRLAGANRSETSVAIARAVIGGTFGFSATTFNVASGLNEGVDALGGAALSGKQGRVLLVTNNATSAAPINAFAAANVANLTNVGIIFGGPTVVAATLETGIETSAGGGTGTPTGAAATSRPELIRAEVVSTNTASQTGTDGTTIRFVFDEEVTGTTTPDVSEFKIFTQDGTEYMSTATPVIESGGSSITVLFGGTDFDTATEAAGLTLATVDVGAVTDNEGQANPIGDAALGTTGTGVTLTAGVTSAPDLLSVGNLSRQDPDDAARTLVDFVFDESAYQEGTTGFGLVTVNGAVVDCTVDAVTSTTAASATITASCANNNITGVIDAGDVARGFVAAGTVSDDNTATGAVEGDDDANALQATNTPDNNSSDPDLASGELRFNTDQTAGTTDTVIFDFDEAVVIDDDTDTDTTGTDTDTDGATGAGDFAVYNNSGVRQAATSVVRSSADASQVIATFADTQLDNAVGISVNEDAVVGQTGTAGRGNEVDEVGVTNSRTASNVRTPGRTDDPDLLSAAVRNNATTADAEVVYTFDEDLDRDAGDVVDTSFFLVQADGTRLVCTDGNAAVGTTDETDATVVCDEFAFAAADGTSTGVLVSNAQVRAAVLATVDDDAVFSEVTGSTASADGNPDGASLVTGTTGTSAS